MEREQRDIKRHMFICCNIKEQGDFCGSKGPETLFKNIKTRLRDAGLWDRYKVSKSGCLGPCSQGISATVYPDNLLLTNITLKDEDELYTILTH